MELEELIEKVKIELEDIKEHKADYCWFEIEDTKDIIEYLEQLQIVAENREEER
ncbi:MAG: hypothetical protein HFJ28_05765 [Clostridia bacterium]|jgi:hypothetical protein|nr:hypothetical protein [Clostridia bacterium]